MFFVASFNNLNSMQKLSDLKKCEFFRIEVEYLGHNISKDGVIPSSKKIVMCHRWNPPQNVSEVRMFLGFTGYYCHFEKLWKALTKIPLLHYTMPGHDFYLAIDASQYTIPVELYQFDEGVNHPIGFASKPLEWSRHAYYMTKRVLCSCLFHEILSEPHLWFEGVDFN